MSTLIITNGDSAGAKMREARINGEILCWRDILHEGPVPFTATPEELSAIRVDFLVGDGWGNPDEIRASFAERDHIMGNLEAYSNIVLWFEHDLYDQLQLLQILDLLAERRAVHSRLSLIQAGTFLAQETPSRLKMHLKLKKSVADAQFELAQAAWAAFRSSTPEQWASLLRYDTSAMPFLRVAIMRQLEELPCVTNGLTRTETFILKAIQDNINTPAQLFTAFQESEEAAFMGDWSFFRILDALCAGAAPFVAGLWRNQFSPNVSDEERYAYLGTELKLTGLGITTINGKRDAIEFRRIDRWMGGTHLTNKSCWRWDADEFRLTPPEASGSA
ncbi:MAG: DUF1835 domain-containing protein [Alphaproteobacteria bacterium]